VKRLASVIATKMARVLFSQNGVLSHLRDGRLLRVNREDMRVFVTEHVKTMRLVDHGAGYEIEEHSLNFPPAGSRDDLDRKPNEKTLDRLIEVLALRVAKAPRQPLVLRPQQLQEMHTRLKSGEPAYLIARAFHTDVEEIQEIDLARKAAAR
jgi:hypothetical protein